MKSEPSSWSWQNQMDRGAAGEGRDGFCAPVTPISHAGFSRTMGYHCGNGQTQPLGRITFIGIALRFLDQKQIAKIDE